ncbi:MAG: NB-ARC domain-containing protein [Chloroflexota bacterium]
MNTLTIISQEDVLEALRLWHGGEVNRWPLAHLKFHLYHEDGSLSSPALANDLPAEQNRLILNRGLHLLKSRAPEAEDLLRERFEHRRDVLALANRLNVSESSLYYRQRQAIQQLTEILTQLEGNVGHEWQEKMLSRLSPASYHQLVGVDSAKEKLFEVMLDKNNSLIISIDGIGGIGKTALADFITRQIIKNNQFDDVLWITAKHTHLSTLGRLQIESGRPALTFQMLIDRLGNQLEITQENHIQQARQIKQYLKEKRCLVVIDNLETVADYRTLLPEIKSLQNPSKFLLTSRIRLLQESGVFSVSLSELALHDAITMMRNEARLSGFTALSDAQDEDLEKIYNVVGGNPLALKLIVGQLRVHSLPRVLDRFGQKPKNINQTEGIFEYIYQEIWEGLGDTSKATLLALTQAGDSGFSFDHLVDISGLEEEDISPCLEELIQSSLVDLSGSIFDRRYRLHRLSEVFLLRMFEN